MESVPKEKKVPRWQEKLKQFFSENDVFWNNEIRANLFVSAILIVLSGVLCLSYALAAFRVFDVPLSRMKTVVMLGLPAPLLGIILCQIFKGSRHWLKYVLLLITLYECMLLDCTLSIFVTLITCIPVVLSTRYYSRKFTLQIAALSVVMMIISEIVYAHIGMTDLNLVSVAPGSVLTIEHAGLRGAVMKNGFSLQSYIINLFRGSFSTRMLSFAIISITCAELSGRAHDMVLEQAEITGRTEALNAELNMAGNIQEAVLPKDFPAFPTRPGLNLYASMTPAKEVGGDFYDYYLIDDDHLMLVIADVSGKGIPAALFMMISKVLIKSCSGITKSLGEVVGEVNSRLCDGNRIEMFVTAWIGILEISTGTMTAVDAGHEYPFLRHDGGNYEIVRGRKSFVLAGMEGTKYREFTFHMDRGDMLFLYTDGLPEAGNAAGELYGMDRLQESLNRHRADEPEQLLQHVREDADAFAAGARQFDDMTMLALHFTEPDRTDI